MIFSTTLYVHSLLLSNRHKLNDSPQIDEDGLEPHPPSLRQVVADGNLAIAAGADTTSTVISNVFYCLLTNPTDYARLREEVDNTFPQRDGDDPFDSTKLAKMPFLNAVM